ncbi:MAG TPA: hypothetical protein VHM28_01460, partial [Anaerolineales bacterium]|nr:hypothetical protein [Anaerolineales bacterium]
MSDRTTRTPSNILYLLGVLLGLALAVLAIWAAFEGQSYFFTGATHEPFYGLHCPIFMTRPETGTITATFDNPSDQEMQPYYEVEISGPLARKFENQLSVPTYQSKTVEWTVDANDIDLGSFIFVQMQILPDGTHRTRQAVCGIFVLNVPGATGDTIFTLALILSLAGIVVGFTIQDNLPNK